VNTGDGILIRLPTHRKPISPKCPASSTQAAPVDEGSGA
jgi:hypothetical protein